MRGAGMIPAPDDTVLTLMTAPSNDRTVIIPSVMMNSAGDGVFRWAGTNYTFPGLDRRGEGIFSSQGPFISRLPAATSGGKITHYTRTHTLCDGLLEIAQPTGR